MGGAGQVMKRIPRIKFPQRHPKSSASGLSLSLPPLSSLCISYTSICINSLDMFKDRKDGRFKDRKDDLSPFWITKAQNQLGCGNDLTIALNPSSGGKGDKHGRVLIFVPVEHSENTHLRYGDEVPWDKMQV
ncbi:hypothetical protein CK203_089102 [Vitis vinifera]|uniref:Uncharacterized protein n=1 Tax=Vitis vinifera TaxID=29760 RepID=A0A438DEJ6_VITVI|nr:hypothetical protein CK203_089102 [Vitis vinifera]